MKKVKWGLIGAGDIVRKRVVSALQNAENSELISVSRSQSDLAQSFAEEFGIPKWFADWRELVADNEIDAVYIATPVYLHKDQTILAAQNGKHVLCEKPMALNVAECKEMIQVCEANNVKLSVAYYRHFYPVIDRIKQLIESDEIGKPVLAQINAFEYVDISEEHPHFWFLQKEKSGGGPMMDFGCHRLEVLNNLFGEVINLKSIVTNKNFNREVEDTATAIMEFETGTCANLTVTHSAFEPQDTLDIYGDKGSIHIPVLNKGELRIRTKDGDRLELCPPHNNLHQPLIADFIEAIIDNRNPKVSGEIGKYIAELEEKIYREN